MFGSAGRSLLLGFGACIMASCSHADHAAPAGGSPTSATALHRASEPVHGVTNAFTARHGDVQAAFAAARARFAVGAPPAPRAAQPAAVPTGGALVLYDTTGPWGWLGELYAMNVGSLAGHFGQYDEPIVLAMRAGGNLNFGSCTGGCLSATSAAAVTLGSLSDGFWQYYASAKVVRRSIQLR